MIAAASSVACRCKLSKTVLILEIRCFQLVLQSCCAIRSGEIIILAGWFKSMRFLIMILVFFAAGSACAEDALAKDGATVQLAGVTFKLDGIDAPEFDQMCIDEHAEPWACGVEARDQLAKLIDRRGVHCGSGAEQNLRQMAYRALHGRRRNHQSERVAGASGFCAER